MPTTNNILTHQMLAREAAAMLVEEANFLSNINRGREEEFQSQPNGYRKGDKVDIGIPPVPTVYDGALFAGGGDAPDQKEQKVSLQLTTQKHVPLTFTAKEKALQISDFKERFLKPAMNSLASIVQADLIQRAVLATPNVVGNPGSLPSTFKTYGQARAVMERYLTPGGDRTVLVTSDASNELADAIKNQQNPSDTGNKAFKEGYITRAQMFDMYENQSLPFFANGTATGFTVNGAGQTGTTLNIGGVTAGQTILKGTVFSIPGVFSVHPIIGVSTGKLRQFVVAADFTAGGTTGTISIFPELKLTTASQVGTVSALPANGAAAALVGSASTGYRQELAFHKDAFTAAFAPLPVLASCEGYTATVGGFSVRVMTFGNGQSDTESTRIDVLYGFAAVRPDHACRVTE
ncbi:P22 phage major capsid protein family protein [Massilia sp. DD77]|uniref:P22 phage major capsid protein family protein n=1 Tax=Massilia sp. DD77 TaxID=3109349 RepID=UPI002FFF031F